MVIGLTPQDPKKLKGAPKATPAQLKAKKKAELEKKLKNAKGKINSRAKSRTKDLLGALKQNMNIETFANGVESVKQLREKIRTAPIALIEKLEDKYPGVTLAAFTTHLKGKDKLNFKEWSSDEIYAKFKPNMEYTVDFLGCSDAENKWGASDMASIEWRGVTKYEGGNKNKKRVSKKRAGLKGQNKEKRGYYDNRGYIAVHTGDVLVFHGVKPAFKTEFREKVGDRYKEINSKSYEKYAKSKYSTADTKYFEKNKNNGTFLSKKPTITPQFIREVRAKIGSLEGLSISQRVEKVARYLTIPENNIGGKHCGDWVDRVYAIAGVRRKKSLHHSLRYAFNGGDTKAGWRPKKNPDGTWNQKRYDVKTHGPSAYASQAKLDKLQAGDWVWINNRNKYDYAGNHSGVFLRWDGDKKNRRAIIACWFGNKKGRQKIVPYNFKDMPLVHISRPMEIDDSLPGGDEPTTKPSDLREPADLNRYIYREVPGVPESERSSEWDPNYLHYKKGKIDNVATKTAYLKVATKMAKKVCSGTPLNWRVVLAQSILETGWGTSPNARNKRNYFGIMAHELKMPKKQRDRAYKSMYESFMDYRNKMLSNTRYKDALEYKDNPLMALAVILANGYCPAQGYFQSIIKVMKASPYGPAIGIPSTGTIDESELRTMIGNSVYANKDEAYIQNAFIKPAKKIGRWKP